MMSFGVVIARKGLVLQSAQFIISSDLNFKSFSGKQLTTKMPVNNRELIKAISIVSDNAKVRVCIRQSGKGAAVCGAMCLVGGVLLGPRGFALGGALGGLAAYAMSENFVSIGDILMNDLTERQQKQLVERVQAAVADVGVSELALLITMLAKNSDIQTTVLTTVKSFISNELHLEIFD